MQKTFFILVLFLSMACGSKHGDTSITASKDLLEKLNSLNDSLEQSASLKKLDFWKAQLKLQTFAENNPSQAFIYYQLAKNLAGISIDSARDHITVALELVEGETEFNTLKFIVYNGAGMIAEADRKFYQAVFYFNKSATIIMNDDSLQSKPLTKVICLLNAAQGNNRIHQYEKGIQQNKLALKFLQALPENTDKYAFRANSQLFTAHIESGNYQIDSLRFYLTSLQNISKKTNDPVHARFTNEHTGNFYTLTNQFGAAIPYYELVKTYDKQNLVDNPKKISAIRNTYITMANLIDLYVQTKQYAKANTLIKESGTLESEHSQTLSPFERVMNKQAKVQYYFATNNKALAQQETEDLLILKDNILKNSGIQATEEMATVYQLQNKDRSINNLSRTIDVTTQKNEFLLFAIGLLVLLVVSWAILLWYIQRQRKQKQAHEKMLLQQQLLRTQMEPHFIFNTLSTLQSFIRFDEKEKSIKYLNQFGRLLRSSLELSRQNYVPLSEELEAIENYLSLQQMRFDHTFTYQISVDPDADPSVLLIPPMLIQPFVENAIIHGISNRDGDGVIVLEVYPKNRQLLVKVTDNGKGLEYAASEKSTHHSLSGTIAKERLEILARENKTTAHAEITSTTSGTCVLLTLPIKTI